MKKIFALAAVMAFAVGCGRTGTVAAVFKGTTPATSATKDQRWISFHCPACGRAAADGAKTCANKECAAKLTWPADYPCGYCAGSGDCPTCKMMSQDGNKCYNCGGSGTMALGTVGSVPIGRTLPCPNCKDNPGLCPTCKTQKGKCDFCKGGGKVDVATLKTKTEAPTEEKKPEAPPEKQPEKAPAEKPPEKK